MVCCEDGDYYVLWMISGRGRGDGYIGREGLNGEVGGGFSRSRGPNKDGWEEV